MLAEGHSPPKAARRLSKGYLRYMPVFDGFAKPFEGSVGFANLTCLARRTRRRRARRVCIACLPPNLGGHSPRCPLWALWASRTLLARRTRIARRTRRRRARRVCIVPKGPANTSDGAKLGGHSPQGEGMQYNASDQRSEAWSPSATGPSS
jgi:hypothetical protein